MLGAALQVSAHRAAGLLGVATLQGGEDLPVVGVGRRRPLGVELIEARRQRLAQQAEHGGQPP